MTPERLAELKALCEATTKDWWEVTVVPSTISNLMFITVARTALPELIAEVERLGKFEQFMIATGRLEVQSDFPHARDCPCCDKDPK